MSNLINPSHYQQEGRKECIEEMYELFGKEKLISYCRMNAYKYQYRQGKKENNPQEQDYMKFIWYNMFASLLEMEVDFRVSLEIMKNL